MGEISSWRLGLFALLFAAIPIGPATLRAQNESSQVPAEVEGAPTEARINLTITPKRLTFDRSTRSATVFVYNQGNAPATVDVQLVERVMLPSGEIETLDQALADAATKPVVVRLRTARGLVAATPRRIALAPGRGQTVRLRVTPPPNADVPEYRSHLTVSTVPPREAGLTVDDAAARRPGELSLRLNAVFGLSIPVIIRSGTPDVRADIRNVRLDEELIARAGVATTDPTPIMAFDLARLGGNSLYGNIEIRSASGGDDLIGVARGVGVYPEIDSRMIRIPLRRRPAAGEALEVTFVDDDLTPGRVVARATLTSP